MKKILFLMFLVCTIISVHAQKDAQAKQILDKASAAFSKAGGVEIGFSVKGANSVNGTLKLKGNKFCLFTPASTTWYDGRTQWTYLKSSEEVNVSTPTAAQLQQLNPQAWLHSYKKGFNYKYGGISGKSYKIILTPEKNTQSLKNILLMLNSTTYAPMQVVITQSSGQANTITVNSYRTNQNYNDATFRFNPKAYPNAEMIDLR